MDTEEIEETQEIEEIKPKKRYYYTRTPAQIEAFKKYNEIKKLNNIKHQEEKAEYDAKYKEEINKLIVKK